MYELNVVNVGVWCMCFLFDVMESYDYLWEIFLFSWVVMFLKYKLCVLCFYFLRINGELISYVWLILIFEGRLCLWFVSGKWGIFCFEIMRDKGNVIIGNKIDFWYDCIKLGILGCVY